MADKPDPRPDSNIEPDVRLRPVDSELRKPAQEDRSAKKVPPADR